VYLESLAVLPNLNDTQYGYYNASLKGAGSGKQNERVLRETLYELPSKKYPEGLFSVRLNGPGGQIPEAGPLPYHDTKDNPFIPVKHFRFKKQAGRVWGKTVASDLIPLQDQRNQTEAMMVLCERRMANPVWLIPDGLVPRLPSGEPGEAVTYTPFTAGGANRSLTPTRIEGVSPAQYFQYRLEDLDRQMEKISGSFGIAHGEAPPGITAASALALLGERQSRQVSPQVREWEMSWEAVSWQQLMIFREYAVDPRVRVRRGDNSRWQIEKWSKAELTGAVDASVEFGSATPKSSAQRRAQLEALIKLQIVNPMDPEQNRKLLEKFGEEDMVQHVRIDVIDAQRENERFMRFARQESGGRQPVIRPLYDNHEVHLFEHVKLAKTDEFLLLEQRAQQKDPDATLRVQIWAAHVQEHIQIIQEAQMAQQAAEAEEEGGQQGNGPGRPKGTDSTFDRGRRAPEEEESRAISEPRAVGGL
jgi:hypothetical protein